MKRPHSRTLKTSFGTMLKEVNPYNGQFELTKDYEALIDTPIEQYKGTKKNFLKGSVVEGNLWEEIDERVGKKRKVVMIQDDNGRYLIGKEAIVPITQEEIDAKNEITKLEERVNELLEEAKTEGKEVVVETKGFLEKDYMGFKGKQIIAASLGVIVLIKLFK